MQESMVYYIWCILMVYEQQYTEIPSLVRLEHQNQFIFFMKSLGYMYVMIYT